MLYIGGSSAADVEPYAAKAKKHSTLIITEGTGLVERLACINFIVLGNQIRYEMNRRLCKEAGLVVSNSIENLATRVVN
ncbi:MAG: hypothetical protein Kow0075_16910 [Salibacteraceae bacterium]